MRSSLLALALFAGGVLAGMLPGLPAWLAAPDLVLGALYLLLFLVGLSVGANREAWRLLRRMRWRVFLVPLAIAAGTLAGVSLYAAILPGVALGEAWAIGAGFGYYSLSSVLITQLRDETLGVVALLANLGREMVTLVLAPWLARHLGRLSPVAAGAATAMDTTLPVIARHAGGETAVIAFFSGLVLTLLVPVLVPLFLRGG